MSNKKILFISSYAPPSLSGAAQNIYNLIKGFPTASYYMLTSFYNIDGLALRLGQWLPGGYTFYDRRTAQKEDLQQQTDHPAPRRSFAIRLKNWIRKLPVVGVLTGIPVIFWQVWDIYQSGYQLIKRGDIGLMMGFSDYGPAMLGTYLLHRSTKTPFWIFLFDVYKGNTYFFPGNHLANWLEERLFRLTTRIIATNEGTKAFYVQRYGDWIASKIVVIHNSAHPETYQSLRTPYQPKPPYTIMFTGSIYWPQIRSLQNLVKAVNEINDLDIRIKLYSPHTREYIESYGLGGPKVDISVAAPGEMARIQNEADILFLPLSWGTKSPDIINTATPGKLADYLAAERPILVHSPAESYLAQYAKSEGYALVVDHEDIEELKSGLRRLLIDLPYAQQLISHARQTFIKNHDANNNSQLFKQLLLGQGTDKPQAMNQFATF
jgi:glycosyltransferase involved in cell wall biosynthesis